MKAVLPKHLTDIEAIELIHGPQPVILTRADMRPYQNWMADKIIELPAVLLGAEMGLGKTGAVLRAIVDLMAQGIVKKVLIVAPLRVAALMACAGCGTGAASENYRNSSIPRLPVGR